MSRELNSFHPAAEQMVILVVPERPDFPPLADLPGQGTIVVMPEAGFEPAQSRTPRDFKSLASTNSATPAKRITKN